MTRLFYEGGAGFMGILTLIFLVMMILVVSNVIILIKNGVVDEARTNERLSLIKSVGLFAMVVGILGQLIGLYYAFTAIKEIGDVNPGILAGGLKVSLIPTIYGIVIYLISHLLWFALVALKTNLNKR